MNLVNETTGSIKRETAGYQPAAAWLVHAESPQE